MSLLALSLTFLISVSNLFDKKDALKIQKIFNPLALEIAAGVAIFCTGGSLFLSDVLNFEPCFLCWIQRGFMYPAAFFLGLEAFSLNIRKKYIIKSKPYLAYFAGLLATLGLPVAIFHRWEQAQGSNLSYCDAAVPCSARWINEYGFITIPTMAGIGFLTIITFVLVLRNDEKS